MVKAVIIILWLNLKMDTLCCCVELRDDFHVYNASKHDKMKFSDRMQ